MVRLAWLVLILAVYALHQDIWFWREARPLVFGFLPIGLAYHGAYCLAVAALMWLMTRALWPSQLDEAALPDPPRSAGHAGRQPGVSPREPLR
jgi:hypothetical protein